MESDLIHRLENATEGQERELLMEVFVFCFPGYVRRDLPMYRQFLAMLDAHAWSSAAEMLVPEGWYYAVAKDSAGAMAAVAPVPDCSDITRGPFPWAALAAASVKARG